MGEPAEPKVILRSPLSFSQVILSVVLPFSMLSWSESSTYSAVTPVGRVMLSRKRQRAGLFVLDHKRNSVIQVGIAAIVARVLHALVKVIVLIVFLILIGGFIRVDGDIKGVIFVDLDLIKAAAGDLALFHRKLKATLLVTLASEGSAPAAASSFCWI